MSRLTLLFLLFPLSVSALNLDPGQTLPVDPKVRAGTLENGLRFLIRENGRPEKRAELRLVVNAGSILEDDDQQGLAHFLEHMAFNGTRNFKSNDLISFLEKTGMRFGPDINAYTSFDETVYMLEMPTDDAALLEKGFLVLSDWAAGITLAEDELEKERGVVMEEWRGGLGAEERVQREQFPVLLRGSRYPDRLPIGKPEILEKAPVGRLRDYYEKWYRPDLMAVIVVGDFEADVIEGWIRKHFDPIPTPKSPAPRPVFDVPAHDEVLAVGSVDPEMPQTVTSIVFKHPRSEEGTVGAYRRGLVENLFSTLLGNRLDEIQEKPDAPFLFAGVGSASFVRTMDAFSALALVREGEVERATTALMTEIARVRQHGFGAAELDRAKADFKTSYEHAYEEREKTESSSYVGEYTRHVLDGEPIPGIEFERELGQALLEDITLEEVQAAIGRLVHEDNTVIAATGPKKEGLVMPAAPALLAAAKAGATAKTEPYQDALTASALMTSLPEPGTIASRKQDDALGVTMLTLSNGMEVWLKQTDFKNDQVLFRGQSLGGTSLADPKDYPSASTATQILGEAGYGGFTPTEIEKLTAGKLAGASPNVELFTHGFRGSSSPEDLETALQVLYLNWTAPNDRADAFDVLMDRYRSFIENRTTDPEARYGDRVAVINYSDHYMFQPPTLEGLAKVDRGKALAFYQKIMADASDFRFFFVGAFDPATIEPLIARYLGSLPSAPGTPVTFKDPGFSFPKGVVEETVHAGTEPKSQTQITWPAHTGLDEMAMFHLRKANEALRIRLREILREELGSTYSVQVGYGSFVPYGGYETTSIAYGCSPENADRLVAVVLEEVARFKKEGPTEEETQKVKEQELRTLETSERENDYWISSFTTLHRLGWDPHRILERRARAEAITREKLKETFAKNYPDDNRTVITLMPEAGSDGAAEGRD